MVVVVVLNVLVMTGGGDSKDTKVREARMGEASEKNSKQRGRKQWKSLKI